MEALTRASYTGVHESLLGSPLPVDATLTGSTWLEGWEVLYWVNSRIIVAIGSAQARSL